MTYGCDATTRAPTGAVLLYDIAGPCLAAADRHSFQPWTRHFGTLAMAYHASGSATPYGPEVIRAAVVWAQSMLPDPTLWISGSGDALRDWLYCALTRPARLLETTYPESMWHFPTLHLVCSGPQGLVPRSWAFSVLAGLGADLQVSPERIEVKVAPHAAILSTAAAWRTSPRKAGRQSSSPPAAEPSPGKGEESRLRPSLPTSTHPPRLE